LVFQEGRFSQALDCVRLLLRLLLLLLLLLLLAGYLYD
jgi:hypothetical protein